MKNLSNKRNEDLLDALFVATAPGAASRNDPSRKAHIANLYKELERRGYKWAAQDMQHPTLERIAEVGFTNWVFEK